MVSPPTEENDIRFALPYMPRAMYSAHTLELLGLTPEKADSTYRRWTGRHSPAQCPDDLIHYVCGNMHHLRSYVYRDMDPREALRTDGMSEAFIDAILDPEFADLQCTYEGKGGLFQLVRDTVRTGWRALEMHYGCEFLEDQIATTISSEEAHAATITSVNSAHLSFLDPRYYKTVSCAPPIPDEYMALYKPVYASDMLNGRPNLVSSNTGDIRLASLASHHGGDFSTQGAVYWYPEREVADRYRSWLARRCGGFRFAVETWVVRILVRKDWVKGLKTKEVFFRDEGDDCAWEEDIWKSRNGIVCTREEGVQLVRGHAFTAAG
jgi:hypothetical protein